MPDRCLIDATEEPTQMSDRLSTEEFIDYMKRSNGEPILFDNLPDDGSAQLYFDLKWIRKRLMIEGSCADPEITKIEARLLKHPLLDLGVCFSVLTRVIVASALLYNQTDDPELKRKMLLSARAHLRELQQFPEQWFLALAPFYGEWMDVLRREEELADA
jgi:hypothetical protein